jgi:hypothetical protein
MITALKRVTAMHSFSPIPKPSTSFIRSHSITLAYELLRLKLHIFTSKPLPAFPSFDRQLMLFNMAAMPCTLRLLAASPGYTRRHEAVTRRFHAPHVRLQQTNTNYKLHTKLSNFAHLLHLTNYLHGCQSSESDKNRCLHPARKPTRQREIT